MAKAPRKSDNITINLRCAAALFVANAGAAVADHLSVAQPAANGAAAALKIVASASAPVNIQGGLMTKLLISQAVACAGLVAAALAAPTHAEAACNGGGTLFGFYGMQVNGVAPNGAGKYLSGRIFFNGFCGLAGDVIIGENNSVRSFVGISGSYTTNSDSTIAVTFNIPGEAAAETYAVGYTRLFAEALGVETDSSAVGNIDFKPQNNPPILPYFYTTGSLAGTFVASCGGAAGVGYSDLNYFTFDGAGHIVKGSDYYNNNAQFGLQDYIGYYGVNSDGTFGGYVVLNNGLEFGFGGVIDEGLNEIQYVYSTAGSNGADVVACIAKKV